MGLYGKFGGNYVVWHLICESNPLPMCPRGCIPWTYGGKMSLWSLPPPYPLYKTLTPTFTKRTSLPCSTSHTPDVSLFPLPSLFLSPLPSAASKCRLSDQSIPTFTSLTLLTHKIRSEIILPFFILFSLIFSFAFCFRGI